MAEFAAAAAAENSNFIEEIGTIGKYEYINETYSPEEGEEKFLFCISRMNPPTPGHLLLIEEMINIAKNENIPQFFVILSQKKDKNNPINCDILKEHIPDENSSLKITKKYVLEKMVEKVKQEMGYTGEIHFICSTNPICSVTHLVADTFNLTENIEKTVKVILVAGSDRCDNYLTTMPKMIDRTPQIKSYRLMVLPREEIDPNDLSNRAAISGSLVRKLVIENRFHDFKDLYGDFLEEDDKEKLFEEIQHGIESWNKINPNEPHDNIIKNTKIIKKDTKEIKPHCQGRKKFFMLNVLRTTGGYKTRKNKKRKTRRLRMRWRHSHRYS